MPGANVGMINIGEMLGKSMGKQEKIKKMEESGITIAKSPSEIGITLINKLNN